MTVFSRPLRSPRGSTPRGVHAARAGQALRLALLLPLAGCFINQSLYEQRRDELTDDDLDGWSEADGDCNDANPGVHPNAAESCDDVDEDCDGLVDEDPPESLWYMDGDGDGFGAGEGIRSCVAPTGGVDRAGDCDDTDPGRHPGAVEVCDDAGEDEDCDGLADDRDPEGADGQQTWYIDADGDGFGAETYTQVACAAPGGYAHDPSDCDDLRAEVNPAQTEVCGNRLDDDCDGTTNGCRLSGEVELGVDFWVTYGTADFRIGAAVDLIDDIDGDGRGELVTSFPGTGDTGENGAVVIYTTFGEGAEPKDEVGRIENRGHTRRLGERIANAGDFNGDGHQDIFLADSTDSGGTGSTSLFHGPLSGTMDASADGKHLVGPEPNSFFGLWIFAPGDVDGDERPDFLVSAYGADTAAPNAGAVWLLRGTAEGLPDNLGDPTWTGESSGDLLLSAVSGDDLNGDGLIDAVLGAPGRSGTGAMRGRAYVLFGPDHGRALADADGAVDGTSDSSLLGFTLAIPGDSNGDGVADLAIGSVSDSACGGEAGGVGIFYGPLDSIQTMGDAHACLLGDTGDDQTGFGIVRTGDVDGNGRADLLVGNPEGRGGRGTAWLVYMPAWGTLPLTTVSVALVGEVDGAGAAWSLAAGKDVNGDGIPDFAVGSRPDPSETDFNGAAYLILGRGL